MMSSWMSEKLWTHSIASAPTRPTLSSASGGARREQGEARAHVLSPGGDVVVDHRLQVWTQSTRDCLEGRMDQRPRSRKNREGGELVVVFGE